MRAKSVCRVSSIQDGGYITAEGYPPERRLHDTKLYLQDAYLTIPVGPKSKIFLRFFWKGVLYQFTCLPFSVSPSARLFTKTLKLVIAFLRSMGIRVLIFSDDILIMADSPERAAEHTEIVIRVLESLGFMIKKKKSILKPTRTILFLQYRHDVK